MRAVSANWERGEYVFQSESCEVSVSDTQVSTLSLKKCLLAREQGQGCGPGVARARKYTELSCTGCGLWLLQFSHGERFTQHACMDVSVMENDEIWGSRRFVEVED